MLSIILACAPVWAVWGAVAAWQWCRVPAKRGALLRRWRDLGRTRHRPADGVVDVSRSAAAHFVGLRVGAAVRGVSYLILLGAVLLHASRIIAATALLCVIWLFGHWPQAADRAYRVLTGVGAIAFSEKARQYRFPSWRRGALWILGESSTAGSVSVAGFALLLCAGLPLAYHSDALITPIPGVYVRHSGLSWWVLGLTMFIAGGVLAWAGMLLDRSIRRSAMRRETTLGPVSKAGRPPVVFLRPFASESLTVPAHAGGRRDGLTILIPRPTEFFEDVATWLFWSMGDVLAIGDASRRSVTVGASHHLVRRDADWRSAVDDLLKRSAAILLVPGASDGVRWETARVMSTPRYANKTLILNPNPSTNSGFLATVGATPSQIATCRDRSIFPIAAVPSEGGVRLLCSTLAEDIDFEAAVEWFLREGLPKKASRGTLLSTAILRRALVSFRR
jgi:hypothetical protein